MGDDPDDVLGSYSSAPIDPVEDILSEFLDPGAKRSGDGVAGAPADASSDKVPSAAPPDEDVTERVGAPGRVGSARILPFRRPTIRIRT